MQDNEDLQKDVQDALKWEPLLSAAEIGVTAKDGIVTLTGTVDSYAKKLEAEEAVKKVVGVKILVEKIEVKMSSTERKKDDEEIAIEILHALKWDWEVPDAKIKVKVEKGWLTLEGELAWNHEKEAAKKAIKNLSGVKGLTNNITIKSDSETVIERADIESALNRNATINAQDIHVHVIGTNVILTGIVGSWNQKSEAERITWNALGVSTVDNELVVEYSHAIVY